MAWGLADVTALRERTLEARFHENLTRKIAK